MRRSPWLLAALLALAACVVNLSFEMKKSLAVQSQAAGAISQNVLVDLSQYQEVQDHKSQIRSLDIDYAEATVRQLNPANKAGKISGSLKLRSSLDASATEVKAGDLQDFALTAGATKRLNGTPELDAFLLSQLHASSSFYVVIDGTADGAADLILDVDLHASMGYDAGLF